MTPAVAAILTKKGFKVKVEKGAGMKMVILFGEFVLNLQVLFRLGSQVPRL